jgi:pyruvate dehydrogenase E2 component (dihydrolipoamide acetyltransferase)
MTRHEFRLPDVGEGVAEGEVVAWLVEPGDTVTEDQPVAEVETDKAVVDVPSPYNGRVVDLHWEVGDVVPVGDVLLTFETDEEEEAGETEAADEAPESKPREPPEETATGEDAAPAKADQRVFAPPHVRRRARELGVDITSVEGTGPSGRVTEADVEAAASSEAEPAEDETGESAVRRVGEEAETPTAGAAGDDVEAAGREKTLAVPATRRVAREAGVDINDVPAVEERDEGAFVTAEAVQEYAAAQEAAQATDAAGVSASAEPAESPTVDAGATDERVPYRGIRRTIGQQMERSKYTAPHVTHHDDVVVERLAEWRRDLKARAEERDVNLTYMPFIMKAVVAGLKEFPYLNSQLDEDAEEIVLRGEYNLGVAVATDAGLMVPVVEHVDQKGILELAEETQSLAARARDRDLAREEMQGSTFTLTNFGAIGGEYATPIINYPEVAILGLGAIQERPVVEDSAVVARRTLPLSLSIDHRVVDGAVAAEFVNTVKEYLADPRLLLLD